MIRCNDFVAWAIYDHPADFPDYFVARMYRGSLPTDAVIYSPDLQSVRNIIQQLLPGSICFARSASDAPCILETWF
jgi:hypothetical protein